MAWFDVEEGTLGFAWYDPVEKEIPYICYVWEVEEKAKELLPYAVRSAPWMARLIVVPAVADGKKYVPFDQASEDLRAKVRGKIEQF